MQDGILGNLVTNAKFNNSPIVSHSILLSCVHLCFRPRSGIAGVLFGDDSLTSNPGSLRAEFSRAHFSDWVCFRSIREECDRSEILATFLDLSFVQKTPSPKFDIDIANFYTQPSYYLATSSKKPFGTFFVCLKSLQIVFYKDNWVSGR